MLQLYVYGAKYSGFLDLDSGATLDIETLSELFDEELALGEFSPQISAPFTPNNSKILGYIEQLNSVPGNETLFWRCDIWNNGMPFRTGAKLTLTDVDGSFNYEAGSYTFTIAGYKGLFGSLIANKTLQDLSLDKISLQGQTARAFATNVMKGAAGYTQYPFMQFAPAAIMNYFDTQRPDYNNEFLANDIANNIVITGSDPSYDWEFGRPSSADPSTPAAPGVAEYMDYRTIPFFQYKWIIKKIFAQFGYTVIGDFFDDASYDKAFMFNTSCIETYDQEAATDTSAYIYPQKHLPKKLIGTFLRDLQFFFCCKFVFQDGNIVRMDYRKSDLASKNIYDATGITDRMFQSSTLDYADQGFKLAFTFDSADSYNGQRVQSVDDKNLVAAVNKFGDIASLTIGRPFTANDLVFVTAENQYYCYSNGSGITAWQYYSEKLFPYTIGNAGYDYECGIAPMCTYIVADPDTGELVNKDMVAADQPGCYYNKFNMPVIHPFDTRIFYIDMLTKDHSLSLPSSFVHNRDKNNLVRCRISLAWYGDDGLYARQWKEWLTFLQASRLIKATIYFNERAYIDFSAAVKIKINGTLYVVHQTDITLPLENAATIELYRMN
ncbi:MAG TPA: hypothetical protein VG847_00945 [Chitinophagaceae bacterium]|nr:hypothetical protein [Chitinophagaceae bacterium]